MSVGKNSFYVSSTDNYKSSERIYYTAHAERLSLNHFSDIQSFQTIPVITGTNLYRKKGRLLHSWGGFKGIKRHTWLGVGWRGSSQGQKFLVFHSCLKHLEIFTGFWSNQLFVNLITPQYVFCKTAIGPSVQIKVFPLNQALNFFIF